MRKHIRRYGDDRKVRIGVHESAQRHTKLSNFDTSQECAPKISVRKKEQTRPGRIKGDSNLAILTRVKSDNSLHESAQRLTKLSALGTGQECAVSD